MDKIALAVIIFAMIQGFLMVALIGAISIGFNEIRNCLNMISAHLKRIDNTIFYIKHRRKQK